MNFNQYPNAFQTSPYVNPYANKLATFDQMAQNIANNPYQQMPMQQQQMGMNMGNQQMPMPQPNTVRLVTSIDETKSVTPAFDGTETYFKDNVNKKFYVKYINLNGLPQTDVYTFEPQVQAEVKEKEKALEKPSFVSYEEFNLLKEKVDSLTPNSTTTNNSKRANTKTADKGDVE